jgi:hypothetical protein
VSPQVGLSPPRPSAAADRPPTYVAGGSDDDDGGGGSSGGDSCRRLRLPRQVTAAEAWLRQPSQAMLGSASAGSVHRQVAVGVTTRLWVETHAAVDLDQSCRWTLGQPSQSPSRWRRHDHTMTMVTGDAPVVSMRACGHVNYIKAGVT